MEREKNDIFYFCLQAHLSSFCFEFSKKKRKFPGKGPIAEAARPTLHPPRQGDKLIPTGKGKKNISHISTKNPPPSNI